MKRAVRPGANALTLTPMRFVAEPFTQHRLQRFHRWAMLWLAWFTAFLESARLFAPITAQVEEIGHRWLDRIERVIMAVVMLRAVTRVRRVTPRKGVDEHRRKDSALARAVVGSALRRAIRSKDLRERIARLQQDIDALVARLLRRLPCGLTRRRPIKPQRDVSAIDAFLDASTAASDTS
ncbi:MAG: hypothetical protein WAU68_09910 [Vitreimonas sp.]